VTSLACSIFLGNRFRQLWMHIWDRQPMIGCPLTVIFCANPVDTCASLGTDLGPFHACMHKNPMQPYIFCSLMLCLGTPLLLLTTLLQLHIARLVQLPKDSVSPTLPALVKCTPSGERERERERERSVKHFPMSFPESFSLEPNLQWAGSAPLFHFSHP